MYIRSFKEGRETRNSAMVRLVATAVDSWPTSSKRVGGKVEDDILPPIDIILTAGDKDTGFGEGGWAVTKPSDGREQGTWLLVGTISWTERKSETDCFNCSPTLASSLGQKQGQDTLKTFLNKLKRWKEPILGPASMTRW